MVVALVFSAKTQAAAPRIERMKVENFMMVNTRSQLESVRGKVVNRGRQRTRRMENLPKDGYFIYPQWDESYRPI